MKNVKRFCIIMLLVIPAAAFLGLNSYAATSKYVKLASGTLWEGDEVYRGVTYKKATDEATIVSIKSSKPKVIEATKDEEYKDLQANTIVPLKLGKSTITVTYKYRGKKYSTSALYTVKKYPAPFKSMKVNGKNVDLKENKFSYNVDNFTKKIQGDKEK